MYLGIIYLNTYILRCYTSKNINILRVYDSKNIYLGVITPKYSRYRRYLQI